MTTLLCDALWVMAFSAVFLGCVALYIFRHARKVVYEVVTVPNGYSPRVVLTTKCPREAIVAAVMSSQPKQDVYIRDQLGLALMGELKTALMEKRAR